jgi:hypothetical protein
MCVVILSRKVIVQQCLYQTLLSCCYLCRNVLECKRIYSNHTDEFISLAVISDYVYIGGKNSLIQLNSSMDIMNIKPMNGSIWLLTPYKLTEEETILIACEYKEECISSCRGYRYNLSTIVQQQF